MFVFNFICVAECFISPSDRHAYCCPGEKQEDGKYKHTIDLPRTAFGLRANSVVREPEIQKLWDENQVFKRVASRNTGVTSSVAFFYCA